MPSGKSLDTPAPAVIVGRHYRELDGLRGIAVLLVIWYHSRLNDTPHTMLQGLYFSLSDAGWIGVELFFVLSGFLITGILLDTSDRPRYFSTFYQRRALRIFPLYYAVLLVATTAPLLFPHIADIHQGSLPGILAYWVYLQNFLPVLQINSTPVLAHFWSLAVEEQFYLVWPMVVLWAWKTDRLIKVCLWAWVACIVFRLLILPLHLDGPAFLTPSRMDGLLLGACIATVLKQKSSLATLRPLCLRTLCYSAAVIMTIFVRTGQFGASGEEALVAGLPAAAVFFASLLVVVLTSAETSLLRKFLTASWLCFIGRISFGMYVVHIFVIELLTFSELVPLQNFWLAQFFFPVIATGISMLLALLSYRFIEQPFLQWKRPYEPAP